MTDKDFQGLTKTKEIEEVGRFRRHSFTSVNDLLYTKISAAVSALSGELRCLPEKNCSMSSKIAPQCTCAYTPYVIKTVMVI